MKPYDLSNRKKKFKTDSPIWLAIIIAVYVIYIANEFFHKRIPFPFNL